MSGHISLKSGTYYFSLADDDIIQENDLVRFDNYHLSFHYAIVKFPFFVGKTKADLSSALRHSYGEDDVEILREIS